MVEKTFTKKVIKLSEKKLTFKALRKMKEKKVRKKNFHYKGYEKG